MMVGASSRTSAITSWRNPWASAVGWPGSKMPPYTQRPRCSMKAPNRRGWVVPIAKSRCRRTSTLRMGDSGWNFGRQHRALEELRIGMLRIVEHRARVAAFDYAALAHDHDAVADVVGSRKIVCDVDDGEAVLIAQLAQQVHDRGAQRGVDHRHRLVGHQQRRLGDQRPSDR